LEALKEAIRKEVVAITPEMILKVMDNYRERLHKFINIQGRHLSDVLFKTHCCKTAFYVLSRNRNLFAISSLILKLFASQIGEFFLPHPVLRTCEGWGEKFGLHGHLEFELRRRSGSLKDLCDLGENSFS